ncbi:MAG: HAD-IA family hydrolase [Burkholderiaceae bacterium]
MSTLVRAISVDLDDTLWPMRPVLIGAEAALAAWLADHAPATARLMGSDWRKRRRAELLGSHPDKAHDVTWLRLRLIGDALAEAGEPQALARPAFEAFYTARQAVELYPDVRPVLQRWAGRYKIIAITNGNADLHRIGLGGLFDLTIGAHDVGAAKPDPRIFAQASERAGVPPGQILHIGDDLERDIHGARAAGMRAAWLRRPDLPEPAWPQGSPPDEPRFCGLHELDQTLTP